MDILFHPENLPVPHTHKGPTRKLESGRLSRLKIARMPHLPYHVEFFLSKRLIPEYVPLVLVPGATCIYRKENTFFGKSNT